MSYVMAEATKVNLLDAVNATTLAIAYRGYVISYWAKPIPDRRYDWDFHHTDFDGAPDGGDSRYGSAASLGAAMAEIDEQIEECEAQTAPGCRRCGSFGSGGVMATEITHVCDGCGERHEGEDRPAPWKHVSVTINSEPDPNEPSQRLSFGYYDLCSACVDRLIADANPHSWALPAKAGA